MSDLLNKPQIGVSACLLGKAVRFDGSHVNNRNVASTSICIQSALKLRWA
jgi:uncharacterized protein YbbK (DUF523 family)